LVRCILRGIVFVGTFLMYRFLGIVCSASALCLAACGGGGTTTQPPTTPPPVFTGPPGDFTKTVGVAGVTRTYLLHVPSGYRSTTAAPVVLVLHGGNGSATTVGGITAAVGGSSAFADRNNFIAVYPDSMGGNWDDGRETITARTNDVGFVTALLDALAIEYNIDTKRVYASGISNGGMMTQRLACELPNRIAAIATVAANVPTALAAICNPGRPMPVALFLGTGDPLMPYAGGNVVSGVGGAVLSGPASAAFWVAKNQISATPRTSALADTSTTDGTTTDLMAYGATTEAGEVAFYRVNGGGHTWPGGTQYLSALLVGRVSADFSANDAMWAFFSRHPRP
jgi:polyhydroxybutyrate depolymerase